GGVRLLARWPCGQRVLRAAGSWPVFPRQLFPAHPARAAGRHAWGAGRNLPAKGKSYVREPARALRRCWPQPQRSLRRQSAPRSRPAERLDTFQRRFSRRASVLVGEFRRTPQIVYRLTADFCSDSATKGSYLIQFLGWTRKAGIWPPPLVTFASPVALR